MEEAVTYTAGDTSSPPDLRLLHYNDVYHLDSSSAEPVGGVARFQTVCKYYRNDARFEGQPGLVTLFSGDAFNPSLESSVTKGSHMVPVLNLIGTDAACVGNHDLDFGVKQFRSLASQCDFPWLLANVTDPQLGEDVPLGNALKTTILTASNGIKIGLVGLVEREWLDTINSLPPNLVYKSVSATAKELVPGLRAQGADIIIAVTHQREPNDNKLAEKIPEGLIDLVLGGHDHYYSHTLINETHVLRSGTDFKQLSYIEARRRSTPGRWDFHIVRRDITSEIAEDAEMLEVTNDVTESLKSKLEKPLGYTAAPLDARFTTVRLKESNLGNFVCDLMRHYYDGDCCLMASGTVRGDQIYPPGVIKLKDVMNCFPFEDPCIVIRITGAALLAALENSVCAYPALEGRFPQVSNISFEFDPSLPPNHRINWAKVDGGPLDLERKYVVVTRGYMGRGKDGFDSLLVESEGGQAEEIVSEENGILISMLLRQYFMSLKIVGKWKHWGKSLSRHWDGVHEDLHETHPVVEPNQKAMQNDSRNTKRRKSVMTTHLDDSDDEISRPVEVHEEEWSERELRIIQQVMRKWRRLAGLKEQGKCCDSMSMEEFQVDWTRAIAPRLEGRIRMTKQVAETKT
ncbi:5'-nucleotidase [Exophiala viscosa]|uniref:5'-nucleotidase n=1 Tax=Exophiala viscosa TaxID=2486360 RepID=UPI002194FFD8|nr:5'-nucleotidase [Exophiala viscosa]